MSNTINLTGEGQEEPQQPASRGRSDSDNDYGLGPWRSCFFFFVSNDPDPAAGATSRWQELKWAAPTQRKSSPDCKFFLVGAADEISVMHLLKNGKKARQLGAEVGGVGADLPPPHVGLWPPFR